MTRYKIRKTYIYPSVLALAIFVTSLLASNYTIGRLTAQTGPLKSISQNIDVTHLDSRTSKSDALRADEYAFYAENLNDMVRSGQLKAKQRDFLLNRFESNWS